MKKVYHKMEYKINKKVTCIILSWNTPDITKESAIRLLEDVERVIIVDNGSDNPPTGVRGVKYILNKENVGNSIARNQGIKEATGDILMLDGDILYVPNSVSFLKKVLDKHQEAGCVGFDGLLCSMNRRGGETNYAESISEPDIDKKICSIPEDQPIAWTQYGLFREEVFKKCQFDESGLFGKPGYGFEDNDLYEQMKRFNWHSYSVSGIKYYHDQSSSKRFLAAKGQPTYFNERYLQFKSKWSK
jgi:GT2 family glycosyltransferase